MLRKVRSDAEEKNDDLRRQDAQEHRQRVDRGVTYGRGVSAGRRVGKRQGWGVGVGIAYGYQWLLSRHWSIEAEIGIGYVYSRYDKYECPTCGDLLEDNQSHNYFGLTKAAINLIYVF